MKSSSFPIYFIISLFFSVANLNAQTKNLDLERFDGLNVSGNIDLILIPDSENYAEIRVEDVDMEKLEIRKKGSTVKFKLNGNGIFKLFGGRGKAYIKLHYTEDLISISSSAAADIKSNSIVRSDELRIGSSSGSTIELEIECNSIDATVSSGGDMRLEGTFDEQDVSASSGGSYKAQDVVSSKVKARASSGGSIKVWATTKIKGKASSGGSIHYKGNPENSNTSSSSGGSIRNIDNDTKT